MGSNFLIPRLSRPKTDPVSNADFLNFDRDLELVLSQLMGQSVQSVLAPLSFQNNILSFPKATASQSGYLSAADWLTFSGKASVYNAMQFASVALCGKSLAGGTSITATLSFQVATIAHTAHGYSVGDVVVLAGGTGGGIGDFNQLKVIQSVPDANHYTVKTTATAIAGSLLEMFWFKGARAVNPTLIKNITRPSTGQYVFTFTNTQADANYGMAFIGYQTGSATPIAQAWGGSVPTTTTVGILFGANTNPSGVGVDANQYLYIEFKGLI